MMFLKNVGALLRTGAFKKGSLVRLARFELTTSAFGGPRIKDKRECERKMANVINYLISMR